VGRALHTPGPGGAGLVTAAEARLDDAGLLAVGNSGAISARTGVLAAPGATALVSGTSATGTMTYAIGVHHWVTNRGTVADGVYRGAAETAQTVPTAAAPGSGSRIDVIYVKQNDQTSTLTPDADSAVVYGVVNGAVGGGKPAIPVGAEELATAVVPAGVTRTDTGVTITQTARLTNLRGGIVPIRTAAELAGLPVYPTAQALELDTGRLRWHDGARWRYTGDFLVVDTATARTNLADAYDGLQVLQRSDRTLWTRTGASTWVPTRDDTGWQPLAITSPAVVGGDGANYRAIDGVCHFQVHATASGGFGSGFTVTTVPVGFRPTKVHWHTGLYFGSSTAPVEFKTNPDGTMRVGGGTPAAAAGLIVSGSFPIG